MGQVPPNVSVVPAWPSIDYIGGTTDNHNKHTVTPPKTPEKRTGKKNKNKNLTVAAINTSGIKGKMNSIKSLLTAAKIQIAVISETKIAKKINIKVYKWIGIKGKIEKEKLEYFTAMKSQNMPKKTTGQTKKKWWIPHG